MKENDIDRLFREAFQEAEETPSKHVWEQIEKQLEEDDNIVRMPSKRKFRIISAAAAIVIFMGSLAFFKIYYSNQNEIEYVQVNTLKNHPSENKGPNITETTVSPHRNTIEIVENENRTSAITNPGGQHIIENKKPDVKKDENITKLKLVQLEEIKPYIARIETSSEMSTPQAPIRQVTEVEDIKPLIEPEEETESMLAQVSPVVSNNKNIVTSILNTISENIEVGDSKEIRFRADEEGSLRIDILNSLVKNRNKKRK